MLIGWNQDTWWEDVRYGEYMVCIECKGDENYKFSAKKPELCGCTKDLVSPNGEVRTSIRFMELMRHSGF